MVVLFDKKTASYNTITKFIIVIMQIKIKIPASTANLGAGFDCLSLGLTLYNQYTIDTHTKKMEFSFAPQIQILEKENKMLFAYLQTCKSYKLKPIPFSAHCVIQIPISIGLGSSANAILAGVLTARMVHKKSLKRSSILQDAVQIENHPENLAGCLYGGFNISTTHKKKVQNFHFPVDKPLTCLLVQTAKTTKTEANRKTLPTSYFVKEVVYNLSRSSLLGVAFTKQDFSLLSVGLEDELHQKYRIPEHLEIKKLKKALQGEDYYGLALSGSGSSLVIFCTGISQRILCVLDEHFSDKKEDFKVYTLKVDNQGASVIS